MRDRDWSREEVELIVDDYLGMLAQELSGRHFNKTAHRRELIARLDGRSESSIEFKHANISAALLDGGFPYITGYKPRANYQTILVEVLAERMRLNRPLIELASSDADAPTVPPELQDVLAILTSPPRREDSQPRQIREPARASLNSNFIEREARNRSLGLAGEQLVLAYERKRLIESGKENLADKIEHVSKTRGDGEGFDILSFDENGAERLIEVKTTKYGIQTPFFVSRNEVEVSSQHARLYHLYRLFEFRDSPRLYTLNGAINITCSLSASNYLASPL